MIYKDMNILARQLATRAEAICQRFFPAGQPEGQYWIVGNIHGDPGQSLKVHLSGPRAGKWRDYATGEHGDLMDIIAHTHGGDLGQAAKTARALLGTNNQPANPQLSSEGAPSHQKTITSARRLWNLTRPITNTPAEDYLKSRQLTQARQWPALRYLRQTFYRDQSGTSHTFPALIANISSPKGEVMGVHRSFLDRQKPALATIPNPKRMLGSVLGHGVKFHNPHATILVIGEGIETILSILEVMPGWSGVAALTASHLAQFNPGPPPYAKIIIAADPDTAGRKAAYTLQSRLQSQEGQTVKIIFPPPDRPGDFNDVLCAPNGRDTLSQYLKNRVV